MSEILRENEIEILKNRAETITREIENIKKRVKELEAGKESKQKIVVHSEYCIGCRICEGVCSTGAITVDNVASIDDEKCILCGDCVRECPQNAIEIVNFIEGGKDIMPRQDGTGPTGQGPGTGRGMGRGGGGGGRGRMGGGGMGGGGNCVCLNCGAKVAHQRGTPCYSMKCPECGGNMTREM